MLGSDAAGAKTNGPVKITVVEPGPLVAMLRIESEAPGCNRLTREVRVVDGLDWVDITDIIDKKAVREKEGVHFGFAFNVPQDPVASLAANVAWNLLTNTLMAIALASA